MAEPTLLLSHEEVNRGSGKSTILFIHGATSDRGDFRHVTAHISNDYHLLLPDLPGHGGSQTIRPFTRQSAARMLAELIRAKAMNSVALVVGHSLGSHIAIELATNHPEVVEVMFISGFGSTASPRALAYGLWVQDAAVAIAPVSMVRWLMSDTEITLSATKNSLALDLELAESMSYAKTGGPEPWPARTLIIAATKSGLLPTGDSTTKAKELLSTARKANSKTMAYQHCGMRHPWALQAPELYAQTVMEWYEDGTVPDCFEVLRVS